MHSFSKLRSQRKEGRKKEEKAATTTNSNKLFYIWQAGHVILLNGNICSGITNEIGPLSGHGPFLSMVPEHKVIIPLTKVDLQIGRSYTNQIDILKTNLHVHALEGNNVCSFPK